MDPLTERLNAMIRADAEMVQECAALLAESAARFCQMQIDIADRACSETARQYRDLLSNAEPAAVWRDLPKAMQGNLQSAAEAATACLENAVGLQSGLIRLFQFRLSELSQRFAETVGEAARAAGSAATLLPGAPVEALGEVEPAREPA